MNIQLALNAAIGNVKEARVIVSKIMQADVLADDPVPESLLIQAFGDITEARRKLLNILDMFSIDFQEEEDG